MKKKMIAIFFAILVVISITTVAFASNDGAVSSPWVVVGTLAEDEGDAAVEGTTEAADNQSISDESSGPWVVVGTLAEDEGDAAVEGTTEVADNQSISDESSGPWVVVGTLAEDEGDAAVEGTTEAADIQSSSTLIFTMQTSTSGVKELYTSYITNKYFELSDLKNDYVKITGKYTYKNSTSENYTIKVGVATYNAITGTFDTQTEWSDYWKNGVESNTYISAGTILPDVRYYGFGKNTTDGSVGNFTGSASYYDSEK